MKADLHQLSAMIDKEYYTLIQMSQQMSEDGIIGETVQSYFSSVEPYDRIALTSDIAASINTMIFSHQNITMVSYLLPQRQESLFSIMPMRQDPSFSDIPLVMESGSIALQVQHQTLNNYMKKEDVYKRQDHRVDLLIFGQEEVQQLGKEHAADRVEDEGEQAERHHEEGAAGHEDLGAHLIGDRDAEEDCDEVCERALRLSLIHI